MKKFKQRKLRAVTVSLYHDQLAWLRTFERGEGGYNKVLRFIIDDWHEFKEYLKKRRGNE